MCEWIIPFRGRGRSGAYGVNFLWQRGNVYVMDNHRLALWCWLREMDLNRKCNFIHIDRHFDARPTGREDYSGFARRLRGMEVSEYLNYQSDRNLPLISWDTYVDFFITHWGHLVDDWYFVTQSDGAPPKIPAPAAGTLELTSEDMELLADLARRAGQPQPSREAATAVVREVQEGTGGQPVTGWRDVGFWEVLENLDYWLSLGGRQGIVNIDLDYFFISDQENEHLLAFSERYITRFFEELGRAFRDGRIGVLTLALSPETCGGWQNAEEVFWIFLRCLELNFSLPR